MTIEFSRKDMKTKELRVRVTEQEKEQLQKEADEMKLNLSRYIRYCIFVKENIDELKKYLTYTQDKVKLNGEFDNEVIISILDALLLEENLDNVAKLIRIKNLNIEFELPNIFNDVSIEVNCEE